MPNFNSIGSGVSEPQVAENRYLGGITLTTVYALTLNTVILDQSDRVGAKSPIFDLFSLVATQP